MKTKRTKLFVAFFVFVLSFYGSLMCLGLSYTVEGSDLLKVFGMLMSAVLLLIGIVLAAVIAKKGKKDNAKFG